MMHEASPSLPAGADPRDMVWSSETAADGGAALNEWSALLSQEIAAMAVTSDAVRGFAARWARYGLGPVDLNLLAATRQVVSHRSGAGWQRMSPSFELLFARSGRIEIDHLGRRSVIAPGSFLLLDNDHPWNLTFPHGGTCPTVHMPKEWLVSFAPAAHDFCGIPLGLSSLWARPLASCIVAIADEGPASAGVRREDLADQLGALTRMLLGNAAAGRCAQSRDLKQRIVDYIADAHADPGLDPAMVAQSLSISTRHLHRVLARYGLRFSGVLRHIRLSAAASLLTREDMRDIPIGEIAWRVGYADQSHFARVFRADQGCSPADYRGRARRGVN